MKKKLLSGLIGILAAQPALSLDLIETYEKALSYDSGIAAARASFDAEEANADVSRSTLLPQIGAFGEVDYNNIDGSQLDDSYTSTAYGVRLTQPLFRGELWYQYDASKFQSESARARYNLAQQQLILDVAAAYFNVLRASDNLTAIRAAEAAIQRQYEQAQERFDVGLIAITGVYEARASYDSTRSLRIAAESDKDIARERLARLTGEFREDLENLRQNFPLSRPEPMNPTDWETTALEQNWSIQSAIHDLSASKSTLDVAKSGHYPTLDLGASYGSNKYHGSDNKLQRPDNTTNVAEIGVTLNVPLYTGGGTQSRVRQQRSLVEVAEQTLETVRRDVRVNTRSLYRTVNTNLESTSALGQTIISRRSALDATRAGYDVGTRNIVEVLDAEQAYYEALRDFANSRYDYVINTLQLKLAAGTLSPQDLIDLNNWLSASAPGIEALATDSETIEDAMQL